MSLLALQLPARARLSAQDGANGAGLPAAWAYAFSADGERVQREGSAAPGALPRASATVAVLHAQDVSWHRIPCPKAPPARLRAALAGLLEEALLDETDDVHFALAPGATPGQPAWVATCDRAWLARLLAAVEQAGVPVDRVVPAAWPAEGDVLHFHGDGSDESVEGAAWLTWSQAAGVFTLPLAGTLARSRLPQPLPDEARLSATPGAAAQAERWLDRPVPVRSAAEGLLQAARSPWNLRQFDLAPRHRGLAMLRDGWRQFLQPDWRPVRLGLVGLAAVQVIGLNAWAWQQRTELRARDADKVAVVRQAFPQVQVVRPDVAVLQMQRELDQLRAQAGVAGPRDFEFMLQAAASGWPGTTELKVLRFEPGRLQIESAPLREEQLAAWREALAPSGWRVDAEGGQYTVTATEGAR
jgi:general secretion pathway protein L